VTQRVVPENPPGTSGLKRDPALVWLSRDHHFALREALWLRRSAAGGSLEKAAATARDFLLFYRDELVGHIADEEEALLPLVPDVDPAGAARLLAEHAEIHGLTARLVEHLEGDGDPRPVMADLGALLNDHVRFEERGFFMAVQERLTPEELRGVGEALDRHRAARGRGPSCPIPA
jgi:hypothetical protein